MEKFIIKGPTPNGVRGLLECSGAKNAALPLMASSILFDGTVTVSYTHLTLPTKRIV